MDPVLVEYSDATTIRISWTSPYSNSESISEYEILIQAQNGELYNSERCNGSSASVLTTRECFVPLSVLRAAPFSLEFDELISVKARAYNQFGWAEFNQLNDEGARVQSEPSTIDSISLIAPTSTLSTLVVEWPEVTEDGNSPILSYHLQVFVDGVWTDVKGQTGSEDVSTIYTIDGLMQDSLYPVRARALNAHGWSEWSSDYIFHTSTRPNQPLPATTVLMNPNVRIHWTAPDDNFEFITAYEVLIMTSSG